MSPSTPPAVRHLLVGAYTAEADGHATGIRSLHNTAHGAGKISLEERRGVTLPSPTFLVRHPTRPWVFAVSEGSPAGVSSISVDANGDLTLLSTVSSGGEGACHLAVTRDGRFVIVANYSSGSIATFAIRDDGTLTERVDLLEFSGSGPVADRQQGSHAHQVVVDGDELLVCDLGTDQIHRIRIEPEHGVLGDQRDPIELPAGSGPRHLVVVEDFLVVACELSGQVWFGRRTDDGWEHIRSVATSTRAGHVQPSGIAAEDHRVFLANRGVDTIAVFDVDPGKAWLTRITEFDSAGAWPRDVVVGHGLLWVSNQHSDEISVFPISPLPPAGPVVELTTGSPACVLLLDDPGDAA